MGIWSIPFGLLCLTGIDIISMLPVGTIWGDNCKAIKSMECIWTITLALTFITSLICAFFIEV